MGKVTMEHHMKEQTVESHPSEPLEMCMVIRNDHERKAEMRHGAWVLVTVWIFISEHATSMNQYCTVSSCQPNEHLLCRFDTLQVGDECWTKGFVVNSLLSQDEENLIVNSHNRIREAVADGGKVCSSNVSVGPVANMYHMEYDAELALMAQAWIGTCDDKHRACINLDRFLVSKIHRFNFKHNSPSWREALDDILRLWIAQCHDFTPASVMYKKKVPYSDFVQMIWATTTHVGCARAVFRNVPATDNYEYAADDETFTHWLVCYYGPAGKILNHKVYEQGYPCSKCPSNYSCLRKTCVYNAHVSSARQTGTTMLLYITLFFKWLP